MHQQNYSIIEMKVSDSNRSKSKLEKSMIALSLGIVAYTGIFVFTNVVDLAKIVYGVRT